MQLTYTGHWNKMMQNKQQKNDKTFIH